MCPYYTSDNATMCKYKVKELYQFIKFGIVGTLGFVVDAGVLALCMKFLDMDPYSGRVVSFLIAVTVTWFCNRHFTFKDSPKTSASIQFTKFAITCLGGFIFNYGTYALLITTAPLIATYPTLGVAAGSLVGMFFNFFAAKKIVFT